MPTTFDEHVNEALALIAQDRRPSAQHRFAQPTRVPQRSRPRLALVPRPDSAGKPR